MADSKYFLELPEGIEDMLPARAACFEDLRRKTLDLFHSWGYALVIPPLLEYTEAPSVGAGSDLRDLRFQCMDQLNGRALAIRPDITPQAARIDAQNLRCDDPARLCYAGDVLHAHPRRPLAKRQPFPAGAELYGSTGLQADMEIIALMLETLRRALPKLPGPLCLDLGHVGIYRALAADIGLREDAAASLFEALQRKSAAEVKAALSAEKSAKAERLRALLDLHGDHQLLDVARHRLDGAPQAVADALNVVENAAVHFASQAELKVYLDFAELRGYDYHTGLVFAIYAPGQGEPLAEGGRYDGIGAPFGRARPAVGFSTDLVRLASLQGAEKYAPGGIFVPAEEGPGQSQRQEEIARLRAAGERVVCGLPGQSGDPSCDRTLAWRDAEWRAEPAAP